MEDRKVIAIDLGESYGNFVGSYLRREGDGYLVYLLGVNGEPVPNTDVTVVANFVGITEPITKLLRTNSEGAIKLGKLNFVTVLTIQL